MERIAVVMDHPFELEIHRGAIATPRLIQEGRGEAYFVPSDSEWAQKNGVPGVWYLHEEPRYVSPTGEYRRVRVVSR